MPYFYKDKDDENSVYLHIHETLDETIPILSENCLETFTYLIENVYDEDDLIKSKQRLKVLRNTFTDLLVSCQKGIDFLIERERYFEWQRQQDLQKKSELIQEPKGEE